MIRLFRKPPPQGFQRHSLGFLNIAQFLGVVNDNLFKLILVFMLIQAQGEKEANTILSLAGAVFVIPFLLFSSSAGVLADRYSKQRILRYIKAVEIVILVLALPAFAFKSGLAGYSLLFLLAALHAVFGPSKYGIIPELVSKESIPKANGLITSFTYLGIIIGTFFASFMTEITNYNFLLVVSFSLILAIMGFIASFGVRYTPPQGSKKRFNPYFIREIFKTLHSVRSPLPCNLWASRRSQADTSSSLLPLGSPWAHFWQASPLEKASNSPFLVSQLFLSLSFCSLLPSFPTLSS